MTDCGCGSGDTLPEPRLAVPGTGAETRCGCSGGKLSMLIFPCSGASDTGEITDKAARKLAQDGFGKMNCLAGIGGGIVPMIEAVKNSGGALVIDGCPQDCAKKVMDTHGLTNYRHMRVTNAGLKKGKSPVNEENVGKAVQAAQKLLPESAAGSGGCCS
jgi:uncharacterized metal-binding protein